MPANPNSPAERVAATAVTTAILSDRMEPYSSERIGPLGNFGTEYVIRLEQVKVARVLVGPYSVHVESVNGWEATFNAAGNVPPDAIADVIIAAATSSR